MTASLSLKRNQHEIIRASAGSGKTYQLSSRYIRLLFHGAPPPSILATTFTRKAAGEIQQTAEMLTVAQWYGGGKLPLVLEGKKLSATPTPALTQGNPEEEAQLALREFGVGLKPSRRLIRRDLGGYPRVDHRGGIE